MREPLQPAVDLDAREAALLERERQVAARELAVARGEARLAAAVEAQKELLRRWEREVEEARAAVAEIAARRGDHALDERERELDERERELDDRERLIDRRSEIIVRRELETAGLAVEMATRETAIAMHEVALAQREAVTPVEPEAPAAAEDERDQVVTLRRLSHLVERHGAEHPARVDEWNAYLFFLGEHVTADEPLPSAFTHLVGDVFEPLLDRAAAG